MVKRRSRTQRKVPVFADTALKTPKPTGASYIVSDAGERYVEVLPSGSIVWVCLAAMPWPSRLPAMR
jgi:hypothetical protein